MVRSDAQGRTPLVQASHQRAKAIGDAFELSTPTKSEERMIATHESGHAIVGALLAAGAEETTVSTWLGFVAIVFATINVVGGFLVTDRMLAMFKKR